MTDQSAILTAFSDRLKTFNWTDPITGEVIDAGIAASPARVAWSGLTFKPQPRQSWVRPTILPLEPETSNLGWPTRATLRGFFVIDAFRPETYGDVAVYDLLAALAGHFAGPENRAYFNADGMTVQVESEPVMGEVRLDGGWRTASIRFEYFAQAPWRP